MINSWAYHGPSLEASAGLLIPWTRIGHIPFEPMSSGRYFYIRFSVSKIEVGGHVRLLPIRVFIFAAIVANNLLVLIQYFQGYVFCRFRFQYIVNVNRGGGIKRHLISMTSSVTETKSVLGFIKEISGCISFGFS